MSFEDIWEADGLPMFCMAMVVIVVIVSVIYRRIIAKRNNSDQHHAQSDHNMSNYNDATQSNYKDYHAEHNTTLIEKKRAPRPDYPSLNVNIAVFRLSNQRIVELTIKEHTIYNDMEVGSIGTLYYQNNHFIDFKRN